MSTAQHIAAILAPHLGAATADAVARHLCAKHGIEEGSPDSVRIGRLQEEIRRGLIAFVGEERAGDLARRCVDQGTPEPSPSA